MGQPERELVPGDLSRGRKGDHGEVGLCRVGLRPGKLGLTQCCATEEHTQTQHDHLRETRMHGYLLGRGAQ